MLKKFRLQTTIPMAFVAALILQAQAASSTTPSEVTTWLAGVTDTFNDAKTVGLVIFTFITLLGLAVYAYRRIKAGRG